MVTVYATLGEEGFLHGALQTKAKLVVADAKLLKVSHQNHCTRTLAEIMCECCESLRRTHGFAGKSRRALTDGVAHVAQVLGNVYKSSAKQLKHLKTVRPQLSLTAAHRLPFND